MSKQTGTTAEKSGTENSSDYSNGILPKKMKLTDLNAGDSKQNGATEEPSLQPAKSPEAVQEEYEVEAVRGIREENSAIKFLIKWKNWEESTNTWEPLNHINCYESIMDYLLDENNVEQREQFMPRILHCYLKSVILDNPVLDFKTAGKLLQKKYTLEDINNLNMGQRIQLRKQLMRLTPEELMDKIINGFDSAEEFMRAALETQRYFEELGEWQEAIIEQSPKQLPIKVENFVDTELPPTYFKFITDYVYSEAIEKIAKMEVGCQCDDCSVGNCGSLHNEGTAYYTAKGLLAVEARRRTRRNEMGIFECNSSCKCPPNCINRVSQQGRTVPVTIFKTDNGRGWGLRSDAPVRAWSFVMEYLGEVITNAEALNRSTETYLFDLDFDAEKSSKFTVDAAEKGNVAHFMNHSCDPNLWVIPVWVDVADLSMPRLAFFACRDIKKHDELTFDYRIDLDDDSNVFNCMCGAAHCRKKNKTSTH